MGRKELTLYDEALLGAMLSKDGKPGGEGRVDFGYLATVRCRLHVLQLEVWRRLPPGTAVLPPGEGSEFTCGSTTTVRSPVEYVHPTGIVGTCTLNAQCQLNTIHPIAPV